MSKGHIVEAQSNAAYHQLGTAPSMASMGHQSMESEEDETYSAEPRIPPSAPTGRSYSYGHGSSGWISPEAANGAARASADPNTSWSNFAQGVPETSDISPYTSHAPAVSMSAWSTNVVGLSRIDTSDAWKSYPQGTRSMSYSDDQSGQYVSPTTRPYDDVQASIGSHVMPETSPDAHGTLSAGAAPHMAAYGAWPQSYQYAKPNEDYGGWYEDREHQLGAHVSPTGADPSQHGGMYYGGR
ncbi:hypothetical protein F5Y04DRAFT_274770 [Hypomontagnella monticulosa]|nr:hypothetical protein F5Y04DRAFT_274770 [Hypomontagnella monticulosa]